MYEKSIIVGNLGRDPEMRYLPDGTPVTNINVAVNKEYKKADGTKIKRTKWVRVSVFRGQAEPCNLYLKKGSRVLVEGQYDEDPETGAPRIFTRQDGTAGTSFEMTAQRVLFLDKKEENGDTYSGPAAADVDEDDIPF